MTTTRRGIDALYDTRKDVLATALGKICAIGVFKRDIPILSARTDRQFNRARLNLVGWVVRVKRGFSAAMGGSARLSWYLCALPLPGWRCAISLAQARASPEQARRRIGGRRRSRLPGRRWSNSQAGMGGSAGSAVGSCSAPTASHYSGGPRAGAMWGGVVASPM